MCDWGLKGRGWVFWELGVLGRLGGIRRVREREWVSRGGVRKHWGSERGKE